MESIVSDRETVSNELFWIGTAAECVEIGKARPVPKMVFDRFWLEGELAILFAEAGKGKSILGVQLAEAIASGGEIEPFRMKLPAQKVLYFDLELSDKQFEMRYSADPHEGIRKGQKIHYQFSRELLRARAVSWDDFPEDRFSTYAEYFYYMLERAVDATGAKVVIIDDLAYLRRGRDRNGQVARFLRKLRDLKDSRGLSVLVIARTPTRARTRGTVTLADLEGSSELTGLADNIFAIGGSCADPSLRYLKHIKLRSTEADFDEANVPTFRIEKRDGNFLSFRHVDYADEYALVRGSRNAYDGELMAMIDRLQGEELSQRKIAEELGISKTTVNRYLMIWEQQEEELRRQEEEERERQAKRQKPLSPAQARQQRIEETIAWNNEQYIRRQAAAAEARGVAPAYIDPHPEPLTPCSKFEGPHPDDDKCDCTECTNGRPKQCLEKLSATSRSP
jgi:hypothetical protein